MPVHKLSLGLNSVQTQLTLGHVIRFINNMIGHDARCIFYFKVFILQLTLFAWLCNYAAGSHPCVDFQ